MDYKKNIAAKVMAKETVREAYYRLSINRMVTAAITEPQQGNQNILFNFDKETDEMTATKDGSEIAKFNGDQAWGQAMDYFKRLIHRNELNPKNTRFYMTTSKGLSDISTEFGIAA